MKQKLNVNFFKMLPSEKQGTETNICSILMSYKNMHNIALQVLPNLQIRSISKSQLDFKLFRAFMNLLHFVKLTALAQEDI